MQNECLRGAELCGKSEHLIEMLAYYSRLATEAAAVGLLLLPLIYIVHKLVKMLPIDARFRPGVTIFVAGAAFHLLAEFSGMNKWYCGNSAAKLFGK